MDSAVEARIIVESIVRIWPELPELVPDDASNDFESSVLVGLREVDAAIVDGTPERVTDAVNALFAVFAAHPAAQARLVEEIATGVRRPDIPGAVSHERYLEIPVYYATDRAPTGKSDAQKWFGGGRGDLSFGIVRVSVPDDHRMAALEKPRLWRLEFRRNPERHVVALGVTPQDRATYVDDLTRLVAGASTPEALIFVHGYNVEFADAARRAAQIAYDLNFEGVPMLYSWPSEAATLRYNVDENNALWTGPHFLEFLRLALTRIGAERVHALAHSMGNRVLTAGLVALDPDEAARLGQVVFAAPDVDAQVFVQLAAKFPARAAGRTLYASSNDLALRASQALAGYARAGQSGDGIVVVDGVDTIDASELDTGLMSHSYIGDRTSILSDLYYVIRNGFRPGQRFGLREVAHPSGLPYWVFNPRGA